MRMKMIIFSLLFLSLINGMEHTVVLGSLSLISNYFDVIERIGWFSVLYTLATLVTTPIVGYFANTKPLKPLFRIGLYLLIGGFFLSFIADNFLLLLIGRSIAGIGGGFLSILIPTYLGRHFSLEKRVKIDSYNFLVYSSGTFVGPIVGSLMASVMDWRGIFLLSSLLFFGLYLLLESGLEHDKQERASAEKKTETSFILQSLLFSLFLLSLVIGVELLDEWNNIWGFVGLVCGCVLCFFGFLFFSKKSSTKLFHPVLVQTKLFRVLITFSFVFGCVKFILTNYLSIYITDVLSLSLFTANMCLTVFLCSNAVGNFLVTKWIVHTPYKLLLLFSYGLGHLCFASLLFLPVSSSVLLYSIVAGFGLANGFAGYPNLLILQQKNPEHMGSAAASNTMARHFGGIFGVIAFQQFVIQSYGANSTGFQHGFSLIWIFFACLGAVIFLLPIEKLQKRG